MKMAVGMVGVLLFVATLTTSMPALAKEAPKLVCPSGNSLIGEVCISNRTGDVEMAEKKRQTATGPEPAPDSAHK